MSKLHYIIGQKSQKDTISSNLRKNHYLLTYRYFVKNRPYSRKHSALMPIFCQKMYIICLNHRALMSFFSYFLQEKPNFVMPIYGKKNFNSAKTTRYYGPQKSIWSSCFWFLTKWITALKTIFCQKMSILWKANCYILIFCQNMSILSMTTWSYVILFQFFMRNSLLGCPYLVKNVNSEKNTLYYSCDKISTLGGVGAWALVAGFGNKITI